MASKGGQKTEWIELRLLPEDSNSKKSGSATFRENISPRARFNGESITSHLGKTAFPLPRVMETNEGIATKTPLSVTIPLRRKSVAPQRPKTNW